MSVASRRNLSRADQLLVQRWRSAFCPAARLLLETGRVSADGVLVDKSGQAQSPSVVLAVPPDATDRFTSRGGAKPASVPTVNCVAVTRRSCLEVGQNTGASSDCLLRLGSTQLDGFEWALRSAAVNATLAVQGWHDSLTAGDDGNREFFIWMRHAHT